MRSAAEAAPSFLYLPGLAGSAHELSLAGDEAHYLTRVVRARVGERVSASDGAGLTASLIVERLHPDVVLRVAERRVSPAPPGARLLCGAPEGDRGDWLVEKLAELGVAELTPVQTQRARWPASLRGERWERLAIAALRQSRSAWRLRLGPPVELATALAEAGAGARWLADAGGAAASAQALLADGSVTGAVGPSSGFSDEERNLLHKHDFVPVRLAAARLRTETAALALAALWAARRAGGPEPAGAGTADGAP